MYCSNCNFRVDKDDVYCGKCGNIIEVENQIEEIYYKKLTKFDLSLLGVSIFGLIFILIPKSLPIIIFASVLALSTIILGIYRGIKKAHDIWASVVILSTVNLIIQVGWYVFFDIIF